MKYGSRVPQKLANKIAEDDEASEFPSMSADDAIVWLKSHPYDIGTAFNEFVDKHGHRCINEVCYGSRWE